MFDSPYGLSIRKLSPGVPRFFCPVTGVFVIEEYLSPYTSFFLYGSQNADPFHFQIYRRIHIPVLHISALTAIGPFVQGKICLYSATAAAALTGREESVFFDKSLPHFRHFFLKPAPETPIGIVHNAFPKVKPAAHGLHVQVLYADRIVADGDPIDELVLKIHPLIKLIGS